MASVFGAAYGFDGAVIAYEMERLGLYINACAWGKFVQRGICTMNQHIGHWIRMQSGINDKPMKIPNRLVDCIYNLLPEHYHLTKKRHDVGNDSLLHLLLARELISRARAFA